MSAVEFLQPWEQQPQELTGVLPEIRSAWMPSILQNVLPSGIQAVATSSISVVPEQVGLASRFTNLANQRVTLGTSAEDVLGTTATTIAMLRRCRDATGRASTAFGYIDGTDRCLAHAPYSDGTVYWDYGDQTVGSGRITAIYAKDTNWETLVFVAGPTKGREIWRRGVALARNASALAARGVTTGPFGIGASVGHATLTSDNVDVALFVTSAEEWSDGKIRAWCANPWAETFAPRSIWVPVSSGAPVSDPVGRADESDTAVSLAGLQIRAAGLSSESDAALALAGLQVRTAGLATESDTAAALPAVQLREVGRADETDAAIALTGIQALAVGLAQEADAALALDSGAAGAVGVASEQDSSVALPGVQVRSIGMAAETDTALALYPFVGGSVGLALEIDTSRAMAGVQIRQVGMATESNTALALQPAAIGPAVLGSLTGRMIRPGASRPAAASVGQRRNLQSATR